VGAIQSLWGGHGRPFFIEPSNRSIYRSPGANIALYLRWTPVRAWRMSANLNSDGSPHDVALNVRARAKVEQRKNGPAMRQILSQEKRRQIIAALKDNPNATQIAREVGCVNYRTVVRLAEGAGIELTAGKAVRGHPRVSPEKHAQIIAALKDNPNAKQVAGKIGGVSHTMVGKIAKAAAESGKRLSADERAQIIGALKANPNASEVAKQIVGVSHVAVWKIAKAAGIELTRGKAARDHRPNDVSR